MWETIVLGFFQYWSGKQLLTVRSPETAFSMLPVGSWMPSKESEGKIVGGILALLLSLLWPAAPGGLVCEKRKVNPKWSGETLHKNATEKRSVRKRKTVDFFKLPENYTWSYNILGERKWCFFTWNYLLYPHLFLLEI